MAADIGEHGAFEVFVLQIDDAPIVRDGPIGQILAQRVGVVEAAGGEGVEGRIGVGRTLFVSGQGENVLPDADFFVRVSDREAKYN